MEFSNTKVISGVLILFLVGAAVGRFSLPAKVVTKTETKTVEKEVVKWKTEIKRDQQNNKDTVTTETHYPDGRVVKETHIVDKGTTVTDNKTDETKTDNKSSDTTTEKTTEYSTHDWNFAALGAIKKDSGGNPALASGFDYGLHVQRRVLGPFYLGGFGLTDKTLGASVGVSW
jgi:hypothetical protein